MWWTAPAPGDESPYGDRCDESNQVAVHMQITTIGLDIAKNMFQVHGIDGAEKVVVRKQLRRGQVMKFFEAVPPCLVGMEACATDQASPTHEPNSALNGVARALAARFSQIS